MTTAEGPFEFFTVAYLTQIANYSACTLAELLNGLEHCSDDSIFHHTYQTLGTHHYLTEGFSNDFAQWVLADQLAALDIRDYNSIAALRSDLCRIVRDFIVEHPDFAGQEALERFYFCESLQVTRPFGLTASDLDEFHLGVARLSHSAFYFHFISSRLRLQLRTNDFSHWLANALGLKTLADSINRIDIYTNTLDSARAKLLRLIERERRKHDHGSSRDSRAVG